MWGPAAPPLGSGDTIGSPSVIGTAPFDAGGRICGAVVGASAFVVNVDPSTVGAPPFDAGGSTVIKPGRSARLTKSLLGTAVLLDMNSRFPKDLRRSLLRRRALRWID